MEKPKRIHLLGSGRHEEAIASAIIKPGMLLIVDEDGKVKPHNDGSGPFERLFALEDALQGKGIDGAYAVGDVVSIVIASPGDVVYAFLAVGEQTDTYNYLLQSKGDGSLLTGGTEWLVARNLDLIDNSAGSAPARMRVRIL